MVKRVNYQGRNSRSLGENSCADGSLACENAQRNQADLAQWQSSGFVNSAESTEVQPREQTQMAGRRAPLATAGTVGTTRSSATRFSRPCRYCGFPADTMDHVVPKSRGGTDDPENLVPACRECNSMKGTKPVDEFYSRLDFRRSYERARALRRCECDGCVADKMPAPLAGAA